MDSVVATVSGYHGSERFRLIKLISQSGASYVGAMNPSTTHLVCRKFEGKKYELARKFKTIVVNHLWIEDCIKQGRRVSERPYTKHCGLEVGPLLLEIPVVPDEVKSIFSEASSVSNLSKKPVIELESGDSADDDWTDSWLLKENLLPDERRNKDRSHRLKRKGARRNSSADVLLTNEYCLDESPSFGFRRIESEDLSFPSPLHRVSQKRRGTTLSEFSQGGRRLMHKSICNEVKSSSGPEEDSQPKEIHHNDVGIGAPSEYSERHERRRPYRNRFHDYVKRTSISEDLEKIEDLGTSNLEDPTCNDGVSTSLSRNSQNNTAAVDGDSSGMEYNPRLSTPMHLSCVICWTDFSSTRGVLPCGHRFCFSCIQNWADHMASMKKVSTCPLCKASFHYIQKMEDAVSSDQKIYSQTIPDNPSDMDVYILPHGEASTLQTMPLPAPVCHQCCCREPEELLIRCHSCEIRCVHSYCLDPPQIPWVCVQCKDLRMRYVR